MIETSCAKNKALAEIPTNIEIYFVIFTIILKFYQFDLLPKPPLPLLELLFPPLFDEELSLQVLFCCWYRSISEL